MISEYHTTLNNFKKSVKNGRSHRIAHPGCARFIFMVSVSFFSCHKCREIFYLTTQFFLCWIFPTQAALLPFSLFDAFHFLSVASKLRALPMKFIRCTSYSRDWNNLSCIIEPILKISVHKMGNAHWDKHCCLSFISLSERLLPIH